ncbi:hypothetical protein Syun_031163 [Stephania yunnanensis]|uniref:Uncharacterized protein n=1 Tax=Stephania yunnanensis TaxID=152371 RepID=A0AAP0DWM5_9MAGN
MFIDDDIPIRGFQALEWIVLPSRPTDFALPPTCRAKDKNGSPTYSFQHFIILNIGFRLDFKGLLHEFCLLMQRNNSSPQLRRHQFSNEAKTIGAERLKTRFFLFCNNGSGNIGFIRKQKVHETISRKKKVDGANTSCWISNIRKNDD